MDLLPLRRAISPPVTLSGRLGLDVADEEPDLEQLRASASAVALAYHRDHYPRVAELLPELIRSAYTAVEFFDNGTERGAALSLRSEALQLAGRYLTQVRAYDLAHMALRDAVRDAAQTGDRLNAASAIIGQAWILLRQARFDEAEQLAADTADEVEPRISRATREQLAAWGWLLLRASAAAARNNRPDEAKEFVQLARTAGAAIGAEVTEHLRGWGTFGPLTVDLKAIENELIADRPDRVLEMAGHLPNGVGKATSDNWNRAPPRRRPRALHAAPRRRGHRRADDAAAGRPGMAASLAARRDHVRGCAEHPQAQPHGGPATVGGVPGGGRVTGTVRVPSRGRAAICHVPCL